MKLNMGKMDRMIRVVIGLGIIVAGVLYKSWFGVIGVIPLATALIGWCPLYCPLKISTVGKSEDSQG